MIKSIMLAVAIMLAPMAAYAQDATCMSVQQFIDKAKATDAAQAAKLVKLEGDALQKFAKNMDRLSGGGHTSMDTILMIDPAQNENDVIVLAVFDKGCFKGMATVPTAMVKEALKGLSV